MYKIRLIIIEVLSFLYSQASSDLLGLIQVMIVTFGEQPPVYARQRADMTPTPYPTQREYFLHILSVSKF
jgi:hypothetical protein